MSVFNEYLEGNIEFALIERYTDKGYDEDKLDKNDDDVNYRKATDDKKCGNCKFFNPGMNTCDLVEGNIDPDYWCDLYEPQTS